ncbi:MAG: peptide transporter ATPase [Verrucomicrobiales bacterium]|nr:peptide transporter ATPase [Verrucomicrobiales bacterium]
MLQVDSLTVAFPVRRSLLHRWTQKGAPQWVKAVDDVSFQVPKGKTVGLVGESGSGKTTIARALVKLQPVTSGSMRFNGREIATLNEAAFKPLRKEIQMVFQDPYGSLNPRLTIGQTLTEPMEIHFPKLSSADRRRKAEDLLRKVGLDPGFLSRRPREFSGGQRQRIGIARALAVEPSFIICDEAVSALDVSIQAQIINLLQDLQEELGLTYLFIGHDLAVVEHISDEILVLHHGRLVESGPAERVCREPKHEYTRNLLAAVPTLG